MSPTLEKNIRNRGFVLGVLQASELILKEPAGQLMSQRLINELLNGKMKYVMIKKMAKCHKLEEGGRKLFFCAAKLSPTPSIS